MGVGPKEKTDEQQLLESPGFAKDIDPRMFFWLFFPKIVFCFCCFLYFYYWIALTVTDFLAKERHVVSLIMKIGTETYLEHSQTSMVELFCENS